MNFNLLRLTIGILLCFPAASRASSQNPNTDWFKDAQYGVFMHFLPGDPKGFALVDPFDVESLAAQLETVGAKYFVITLGQNSGYLNSPNATYSKYTGYAIGEKCSKRDLPLDLYRALQPKGIKLMLYLPCQTPNEDKRAQKAFGLREGSQDQPLSLEFAGKWAEVIQEWSDRYGDKVAGWWFDGGYEHIQFNEAIAQVYASAVKHGNPNAIVSFNPGVKMVHYTQAEDYTAGELNEPFDSVPASRWLKGSQWHALTYVGSNWGKRDTRFSNEQWVKWVGSVATKGGVVTLDMGPNYDSQAGPIGSLASAQVQQGQAIKARLGNSADATPNRLTRAESFLGVHFDFHAGEDCTEIGKNTTPAMIESVIDQVHPDYIQIDCKGHPGLSSYPTKVGNQAPGFVGDPLRMWREVTARRGVALYMHYSGVWDSKAIKLHPDWGVINADGSTNGNATSFFGPYADKLLIPQLRELSGDYGVDGAWVDGECWASMPDYSAPALKAFRAATGIDGIPRKPGDSKWYEFLQFNRDAFRGYLRHYITEVKKTNPEMQLCSNWAFTDHMPEAVCAPVDWISGDYSPEDSVNSARLSARYLARQGKPWDLMAWSFTTKPGKGGGNRKSVAQLQREAAVVLALGGGFQAYITQKRDGSIREEQIPTMAEVAKFCRERQRICHHSEPVPQVALLYSTAAHYREVNGLFNRDLSRINGTLQALLESQQSVEVLSEHHLTGRMSEYPLIVIPECQYLEPAFKEELLTYVRAGGSLLLVGPESAALFPVELNATLEGSPKSDTRFVALGKGKIAASYSAFSRDYLGGRTPAKRAFLNGLARQLFPKPMVEVTGSSDVDVAVSRLNGHLLVNLVNTSGPHADVKDPIHEAVAPVGPLEITIRTSKTPAKVTLEPGSQPLKFNFSGSEVRLTLPRLEIHSAIVVE